VRGKTVISENIGAELQFCCLLMTWLRSDTWQKVVGLKMTWQLTCTTRCAGDVHGRCGVLWHGRMIHVAGSGWLEGDTCTDVADDVVVFNLQIFRRRQWLFGSGDGGPATTPTRRVAADGGSVCDENLQSKVFGPFGRNGGVSFAKKWPQNRVSRVEALLH
jgi:hypothetical protein